MFLFKIYTQYLPGNLRVPRSSKCWICPEKLETTKSLKAHIPIQQNKLLVTCPDCHGQEKIFKRISVLKYHYLKTNPNGSLPDEAFMERNGFWMALYPEDYIQVIQPSAQLDEVAGKTKAVLMAMLCASSTRRKKYLEELHEEWKQERETYKPELQRWTSFHLLATSWMERPQL